MGGFIGNRPVSSGSLETWLRYLLYSRLVVMGLWGLKENL